MSGLNEKPKKGTIQKKAFDVKAYKEKNNLTHVVKEKEKTYIPMSSAFTEATKFAGLPRGYATLFRGFSNTGKSTAIYEAAAGAQQIGDMPVIIETEGNWNWEHAKNIGFSFEEVVDEKTGEIIDYEGFFILVRGHDLLNMYGTFNYSDSKDGNKILRTEPVYEDVSRFIDELLLDQANGELPHNLCFLWDSIGTLNCFKSTQSKSSNNMWNAGAITAAFTPILSSKIPASRSESSEYTNTFAAVQKIWLDSSGMGQPVVKHKGGEAMDFLARLIIHFGGTLSKSIKHLTAISGGNSYNYGIETKVKVVKNHIGGVHEEGVICSTPHGYISPDKIDQYKKDKKDFLKEQLNSDFDIIFKNIEED